MDIFRASNYADLSGGGGLRESGRWHNKPQAIIYTGESIAVVRAELEEGYGITRETAPSGYILLKIEISNAASILDLDAFVGLPLSELIASSPPDLGSTLQITREIGDAWLRSHKSVALRVPSMRTNGSNILINPAHRDFDQVRLVETLDIDALFKG